MFDRIMFGGDPLWTVGLPLESKPYEIYSMEEFTAKGSIWDKVKKKRGTDSVDSLRERLMNTPVFITTLPFDSIKDVKPFPTLNEFPTKLVDVGEQIVAVSGLAVARLMAETTIPTELKDFVNYLFLGKPKGDPTNQSAFIAMFHGLHALIVSRGGFENPPAPIVSKTNIPARYMWVVEQLSKSDQTKPFGIGRPKWEQFVTDIQDSYSVSKRDDSRADSRLVYSQLVDRLKAPKKLLATYINIPTVYDEGVPDNETTLGFESISISIFDVFNPPESKPSSRQ